MRSMVIFILLSSASVILVSLEFSKNLSTDIFMWLLGRGKVQNGVCPHGSFKLGNMTACHPWLSCHDINKDVKVSDHQTGMGAQKIVKIGIWNQQKVAVNILRQSEYLDDFQHGLDMLILFSNNYDHQSSKVVQLMGWCFDESPRIITEFHRYGDASHIHTILKSNFSQLDSLNLRFRLCVSFIEILEFLHTHPHGTRVMCDANTPEKALSQLLVTASLTLILNDMDALPKVDKTLGQLVKCGHRELQGDFVAPEQRWSEEGDYDDAKILQYDEKIDIWKIPDISTFILGVLPGVNKIKLSLFNVHSRCKEQEPHKRPSAKEVLFQYKDIFKQLFRNV